MRKAESGLARAGVVVLAAFVTCVVLVGCQHEEAPPPGSGYNSSPNYSKGGVKGPSGGGPAKANAGGAAETPK